MALGDGQGGTAATCRSEWQQSWRVPELAAEQGFLLFRTEPFVQNYNVSSHRGKDRAFPLGKHPLVHTFGRPEDARQHRVPPVELQMAYRFELRIRLSPPVRAVLGPARERVAARGRAVLRTIVEEEEESILPHGIRLEIPLDNIVPGCDDDDDDAATIATESARKYPLLVFLVVLVGERRPLARQGANELRRRLEEAVEEYFGGGGGETILHQGDRQVSKAFPYSLLGQLIQERSRPE
jgi:hypothetical protein